MASSSVSDRFITPLLVCLCVLAAGVGINAATLPAGFTETLVSNGLSNPTAMEFAPDGRLFVCQQGGQLRVIKNGALLSTPFLSLAVDSSGERGLLGIAFDPNFSSNNFVYVYYTNGTASPRHNQVSRFTANGDVAVAGSELVILTLDNLSGAANHNGGAIHFGPDGKLYVAVGENANSSNSQTLNNRLGKLLRINSDGSIPTDNPFYNTATGLNRVIWSMGLRNPYTFAFQPNSGRMFINDVGESTWEEINDGIAGSNYGWPTTEGPTTNPSFRSPIFAYGHTIDETSGCAITGGAFYNPATTQFPASYVGKYFFADFCSGWIRLLDPADNTAIGFATGISSPVDLRVTADGSLYYLARGAGAVFRIQYPANQPPPSAITQVTSSFNPSYETAPVTFTATITANPPQSPAPTGTVDFFDGAAIPANAIAGCSAQLLNSSGVASCTTSTLTSAGSPHTITARYNGDGNYNPSTGTVSQTVNPQSQRTFVSAQHGDDANQAATPACSVTLPCRNFNTAINAVRAGGEVVALDSGGYGSVTISKAVTLTGAAGVHAAVTALTAGSSAITVNAASTDTVVLRGLTVTGLGGQEGINVTSVGDLHVEGCVISGFTGRGIWIHLTADGSRIFIKDTITRNNGDAGIYVTTSIGTVRASIDNCRSERNNLGFYATNNSRVTINRSVASGNGGVGFFSFSLGSGTTTELSCEECVASNNFDGFRVDANSGGAATIRVSHSTVSNNTSIGFAQIFDGVFESLGNNLVKGNGTDTSGTITVITAQ